MFSGHSHSSIQEHQVQTFQIQEFQGTHLPRNQTPEAHMSLGIEANTEREGETRRKSHIQCQQQQQQHVLS